jgi:signal transduction histidine kinase/ligand-binding sensor domain-containing protein/CheY-like chemotaxis protein
MPVKLFFRFFLLLYVSSLAAQPTLRFSYLSSSDGLANNYVHSFCQGPNGFIWIATNSGLSRFDGYSFFNYYPDPSNRNSIHGRAPQMMLPDSHGNLWLSFSIGGLNRLNIKTNTFYFYEADTANAYSLSSNWIRRFIEDKNGNIWIATSKGIDMWDRQKDRFERYFDSKKHKLPFAVNDFRSINYDGLGRIWFHSFNGIACINPQKHTISSLGELTNQPELDQLNITVLLSDHLNHIWVGTAQNGLYLYNILLNKVVNIIPEVKNIKSIHLTQLGKLLVYVDNPEHTLFVFDNPNHQPYTYKKIQIFDNKQSSNAVQFAEDMDGTVWIGSRSGLFRFYMNNLELIPSNQYLSYALKDDNINAIFVDRQNNLWVAPYRRGINKADLFQKPFVTLRTNSFNSHNSLAGNNITSIMEDSKHQLWVGCFSDGLSKISADRKTITKINIKTSKLFNINDNVISAIFEDHLGYIWLGYYGSILDRLNPRTNEIVHYSDIKLNDTPKRFSQAGVRKIISDSTHNLWMATSSGLVEYNFQKQTFTNHTLLYDKAFIQRNSFFRYISFDRKKNIWICSHNGGLIYYDRINKKFTHYTHDPQNPSSIPTNTVYYVLVDSFDNLWVGTALGLCRFYPKQNKFVNVGSQDGLNALSIYSILKDKNNNLWLSTDKGLVKYNSIRDKCTYYNQYDGLPNADFNTTAHFKSYDEVFYFGTAEGLVTFNPLQINPNPTQSKPKITELKVFNRPITPGDTFNGRVLLQNQIGDTRHLILNYDEADFMLEFSAMHFSAPYKIKYEYQMEGYSSKWISVDAFHRWASFTGLPPGEYTFRLHATNNDGIMCSPENEVTLKITIRPPFWQTWWFKILLALLVIGALLSYLKIHTLSLQKQKKELEIRVRERTRELEEANVILEERQEEINMQREEIQAQYDSLEETNKELTEQREKILKQNQELDAHRNNLEGLVTQRTQDLEKALLKAEESERLKSAFLSNMSHEIRTPMNAILGFSSLLEQEGISESERQDYVNIIRTNGNSLMVLINDILDLSRLQSEQVLLHITEHSLLGLLREVFDTFSIEAANKKITLELSISNLSPSLKINTDEIRFKQVFGNLISNAIKFTSDGCVEFGIKEMGNHFVFFVKDTGIGIPENIGNNIFERFLKVEDPKVKLYGGTGLGLAISKQLVELWGGKIWYESKVNEGTTFWFSHPIRKQVKVITGHQPLFQTPPLLEGKVVLIAEDEAYNYKLLSTYLTKTMATVVWVNNGQDAINYAKDNIVDLILMDIRMPGIDGKKASEIIKQQRPNLPIIAQSAFALEEEKAANIQSGIDIYLAKPIKQDDLFIAIRQVLNITI